MRWVFVPSASDFGYGGHWTFEGTARFSHHRVVTEMEVQRLHDVGRVIFRAWGWGESETVSKLHVSFLLSLRDKHLVPTVLPDLLRLRPEGDVGLLQVEQCPRLGAEVGPVEAGQRHVVAMEAHGPAQLHGILRQRHLEEGDVAAGDYL